MELATIFPCRFVMLEKVRDELMKRSSNFLAINMFLISAKVPVIPMPAGQDIVKEYLTLKRTMDDGEAACLAVARFDGKYVASSNLKDIAGYCITHGIVYYTTMDLLVEAVNKKLLTEAECNQFIMDVRSRGSRLPCSTMAEYRKMKGL